MTNCKNLKTFVLKFQEYTSTGARIPSSPGVKTKFKIKFQYEIIDHEVVIYVPKFGFAIPNSTTDPSLSGYLKSKPAALPKEIRPQQEVVRLLPCNDIYTTAQPMQLFVQDCTAFQWSFGANGQVEVKAFESVTGDYTFTNQQSHVQLHTVVRYRIHGDGERLCCNQEIINWVFDMQYTDFVFDQIPGTTFEYPVQLKQINGHTLYKIKFPALTITTTVEPSPENGFGFSLGNFLKLYQNPLPKDLKPTTELVYYLVKGTFNDGENPVTDIYAMFGIDQFGQLFIQNASQQAGGLFLGSFGPTPYVYQFQESEFIYWRQELPKVCDQLLPADFKFSDISQFPPDSQALNDGYRDSHVNDAFKNEFVMSYTSNEDQADKTNGTLDAYFVKANLNECGEIHCINDPIRLTSLPPNVMAWDTAVAINRKDPNIIIESYAILDHTTTPFQYQLYYRRSLDGGLSFLPQTLVFPTSPSDFPNISSADARGVLAAPNGDFWICLTSSPATNFNNPTPTVNVLFFRSTDFGASFQLVAQTTDSGPSTGFYDYPQFCYGPSGLHNGDSGIWFVVGWTSNGPTYNYQQLVGYISSSTNVMQLLPIPFTISSLIDSVITCDSHGNLYITGVLMSIGQNTVSIYGKKAGSLDLDHFWPMNTVQDWRAFYGVGLNNNPPFQLTESYPSMNVGMDFNGVTVQDIVIDEQRGLIFVGAITRINEDTQGIRQTIWVGKWNNGKKQPRTWKRVLDVGGSKTKNCGYISFAFDKQKQSLCLSYYDAINSNTGTGVQYFAGCLPSESLDKIRKFIDCNV